MKYTSLILLILFALSGCQRTAPVAKAEPPERPVVRTVLSSAVETAVELPVTGNFAATASAALGSEIEGIVAATPVGIGDFVREGAPVLELQKTSAQLRLKEAEAREKEAAAVLAQAEARLGAGLNGRLENVPEAASAAAALEAAEAEEKLMRIEEGRAARLLSTGDVARGVHDRARTNLAMAQARTSGARRQYETQLNQARLSSGLLSQARAALDSARAQTSLALKALADATIRAPFSGYVSARATSAGEFVNNQSRFLTLDRITPLKLELQVPEGEIARLRPGLTVRASVQAWPAESFEGAIVALSPSVQPASRSLLVEARFPNTDLRLKPGMFATARIDLGSREKRTVIPAAALEEDNRTDARRVWVLDAGRARLRLVEIAQRRSDQVQIRRGLEAGLKVILGDRAKLYDGAAVEEKQ
jgi:multidrug efflux pump subunit AcrA (membrane-fusion protein)